MREPCDQRSLFSVFDRSCCWNRRHVLLIPSAQERAEIVVGKLSGAQIFSSLDSDPRKNGEILKRRKTIEHLEYFFQKGQLEREAHRKLNLGFLCYLHMDLSKSFAGILFR